MGFFKKFKQNRQGIFMERKRYSVYFRGIWKSLLILALGGGLAGFCNGLLGAGGGIILVLTLNAVLPKNSEKARSVYANALCVMLPLSLFTLLRYAGNGVFSADFTGELEPLYMLGAVAGGVLGGILLGKTRGAFLGRLFALLTLISGLLMITR